MWLVRRGRLFPKYLKSLICLFTLQFYGSIMMVNPVICQNSWRSTVLNSHRTLCEWGEMCYGGCYSAVHYVIPILGVSSCLHIMGPKGHNRAESEKTLCFVAFVKWLLLRQSLLSTISLSKNADVLKWQCCYFIVDNFASYLLLCIVQMLVEHTSI